jgi:predicted nucleic acid-binding protein
MRCVVDASVAAKWFVQEDLRADAMRLFGQEFLRLAPDWIVQEVAHVAFKKWRDGEIGPDQARNMVRSLPKYMTELHPSMDLVDRALAITMAIGHPVYDCLYVACAETVDATLVTADRQLCEAVAGTRFAPLVRHLSDLPP